MKRHLLIPALVLALAAAGCGTVMTSPNRGFLSSYAGLEAPADGASAARRTRDSIDPSLVVVADVQWHVVDEADITADERTALTARLQASLEETVQQRLPAAPQGRAVVLRAAITRVGPVSPALNTLSALVLFARSNAAGRRWRSRRSIRPPGSSWRR